MAKAKTKSATHCYIALDRCVLAVAVVTPSGLWRAYIGAVPGVNHEEEWRNVGVNGTALSKPVACAVFSELDEKEYER